MGNLRLGEVKLVTQNHREESEIKKPGWLMAVNSSKGHATWPCPTLHMVCCRASLFQPRHGDGHHRGNTSPCSYWWLQCGCCCYLSWSIHDKLRNRPAFNYGCSVCSPRHSSRDCVWPALWAHVLLLCLRTGGDYLVGIVHMLQFSVIAIGVGHFVSPLSAGFFFFFFPSKIGIIIVPTM